VDEPVGRCVDLLCRRRIPRRGIGPRKGRKNPARAKLGGHDLLDDVQFAGRGLRDHVSRSGVGADRRRHHHQQRQSQYGLSGQLLDTTYLVPDDLRANRAIAMTVVIFGSGCVAL
jgi:hypothetical protein